MILSFFFTFLHTWTLVDALVRKLEAFPRACVVTACHPKRASLRLAPAHLAASLRLAVVHVLARLVRVKAPREHPRTLQTSVFRIRITQTFIREPYRSSHKAA